MEDYYRRKAREYEGLYRRRDPGRREELERISRTLRDELRRRKVLEVACGTGYWTKVLSGAAENIVAVDSSVEMLEIARAKTYGCPVHLVLGDAYSLAPLGRGFDGGMANFWLSHVPRARINAFLKGFHRRLARGSAVFMADNVYDPGLGGQLVRREDDQNTYRLRVLRNGTSHLVLKN